MDPGPGDPLVAGLIARHGFAPEAARRAVGAVFDVVKTELLSGAQVIVRDFASLKITERKAQIVKDPQTGHQFISPAENRVVFTAIDDFQSQIVRAKLSSIVLAVPENDMFAKVVEFHFSRVGWRVVVAHGTAECRERVKAGGTNLVIVDHFLDGADALVEELKVRRGTNRVPVIALFPGDRDPARALEFRVSADEHLVEPFEVYKLLMVAESELARSGEEELIFEQQVAMRLGSARPQIDRAIEVGSELIAQSGMGDEAQELLKAAYREAVGNAAQHGNADDPSKLIQVQYLLDRDKATIVVTDEGPGFDHVAQRARLREKDAVSAARERHEEGRGGGLGIMLIEKCADRVEYNEKGNSIVITKLLRAPAPSGA